MANALSLAMSATAQASLPWNEALSGVLGSISLTAWICLLVPQLIKNYRAQSGEALSMAFLFVWLLGDLSNLTGKPGYLAPVGNYANSVFCPTQVLFSPILRPRQSPLEAILSLSISSSWANACIITRSTPQDTTVAVGTRTIASAMSTSRWPSPLKMRLFLSRGAEVRHQPTTRRPDRVRVWTHLARCLLETTPVNRTTPGGKMG